MPYKDPAKKIQRQRERRAEQSGKPRLTPEEKKAESLRKYKERRARVNAKQKEKRRQERLNRLLAEMPPLENNNPDKTNVLLAEMPPLENNNPDKKLRASDVDGLTPEQKARFIAYENAMDAWERDGEESRALIDRNRDATLENNAQAQKEANSAANSLARSRAKAFVAIVARTLSSVDSDDEDIDENGEDVIAKNEDVIVKKEDDEDDEEHGGNLEGQAVATGSTRNTDSDEEDLDEIGKDVIVKKEDEDDDTLDDQAVAAVSNRNTSLGSVEPPETVSSAASTDKKVSSSTT